MQESVLDEGLLNYMLSMKVTIRDKEFEVKAKAAVINGKEEILFSVTPCCPYLGPIVIEECRKAINKLAGTGSSTQIEGKGCDSHGSLKRNLTAGSSPLKDSTGQRYHIGLGRTLCQ